MMKHYVIVERSSTVITTVHCGDDSWVNVAYLLCSNNTIDAYMLCSRIKIYYSFFGALRDYLWIIKRGIKYGYFWKSFRRGNRYYIEKWQGYNLKFMDDSYLITDADLPF